MLSTKYGPKVFADYFPLFWSLSIPASDTVKWIFFYYGNVLKFFLDLSIEQVVLAVIYSE